MDILNITFPTRFVPFPVMGRSFLTRASGWEDSFTVFWEFLIRWDNVTSSGLPLLWPPRPDSAGSERLQLLS